MEKMVVWFCNHRVCHLKTIENQKTNLVMNRLIIFTVVLFSLGCGNYDKNKESISSGTLKIGIDESYSLMMDAEMDIFKVNYPNAQLFPQYLPETDVLNLLLQDSIQAAIVNRALTDEELKMFEAKKRFPESTRIAVDGVAFITHPSRKGFNLTTDQVKAIMTGEITTWGKLDQSGKNINVVLDNKGSCNARFIRQEFLQNNPIPDNFFATEKNEDVINYVAEHEDAIGVISVSWISDRDDSTSLSFLKKIHVVGVVNEYNQKQSYSPRLPFQAYILDQSYPYRRDVYIIRTGLKGSLGTGFASFLAGEKGQLIIHKMGMVAAKAPVRTIKIKE
jgi:phosphate transport system substrate-binding protein